MDTITKRGKTALRTAAVICIFCLLTAGCTGLRPDLVPSGAVRTIPTTDEQAAETFFSRWTAYTTALADGAEDLQDVYQGLSRTADTWKAGAYTEPESGQPVVALYLPDEVGTLTLRMSEGRITSGTVFWYTEEERDVSATLSMMVACNALAYGLSAGADAGAAADIYNACAGSLVREATGILKGGPEYLGDYSYTIVLNPEDGTTTFSGTAM